MTNDLTLQRKLCLDSIERVLKARRESGAEPATPPWLLSALCRLVGRVPVTVEYEPMCLDGVRLYDDVAQWGSQTLSTRWLMQRGWDLNTSLLAWRNFRTAYPQLRYDPVAMQVMSRDQLIDEFGTTFGNLLANLCIDPDSQPIFHALLHKRFEQNVRRPMAYVELSVRYMMAHAERMEHELPNFMLRYFKGQGDQPQEKPVTIDDDTARNVYHRCTGHDLQTEISLHPIELDYEDP